MLNKNGEEEIPLNVTDLAKRLTEHRKRVTHPRLVRRAWAQGAPCRKDPLTRKRCALWSEFMEWYDAQLGVLSTTKSNAAKAGARS